MKNLKIRTKLLLGFAFVSMLTLIVGTVGTVGLKSTDSKYSQMVEISTTGISSMADIRELYILQRLALRGLLIDLRDPVKAQADIDQLKEYEAQMAEAMAVYESTIINPEDEQDYYKAKNAYSSDYAAVKQKFVDAAQIGDYAMAEAAYAEGVKASAVITEGLRGSVDYMTKLVESESAGIESSSTQNVLIQISAMAVAAILAISLGLYISSLISQPIKTMSTFFIKFGSTGDLALSDDDKKNIAAHMDDRDEIGMCIAAAVKMVSHLTEINEKLGLVANGDLTVDIQTLSDKDTLGLSVLKVANSLNTMFGELRSASGQVTTGAEQISQGAQELAAGSSEQAASIEQFSHSLLDFQEKTRLNAENSVSASKVNEKMGIMLEESVALMSQMLEAMKEIDEGSKSITRVIKVIDDIAFQTNILALNAAVEAARAGQHGKGFAVVADEVRNLASKSADAAKETAALIEGSSAKVREGNQIVDRTNASLEAVAENSKEVVRLIDEVSASSAEQARAIDEMNHNLGQISNVVQENSSSAEESAAAAEEMSTQANTLNGIVERFKLKATSNAPSAKAADKKHFSVGDSSGLQRDVNVYDDKYK